MAATCSAGRMPATESKQIRAENDLRAVEKIKPGCKEGLLGHFLFALFLVL